MPEGAPTASLDMAGLVRQFNLVVEVVSENILLRRQLAEATQYIRSLEDLINQSEEPPAEEAGEN